MGPINFQIILGNTIYVYDWTYMLCLAIGWITVALYARRNFDQPTYEVTSDEPASIMIPPVIASHGQYARGLMIYFCAMTLLYLGISFAGPTVVIPILDLFQPGHSFTDVPAPTPVPDAPAAASTASSDSANRGALPPLTSERPNPQWPIGVALAIIGLAPSIMGLRQPELLIRRFSHRIAAIPAYTKYVASQMRRSKFDYDRFQDFRYSTISINYKPAIDSPNEMDRRWRKLCILYAQMRKFEMDDEALDSSLAPDAKLQRSIDREIKTFGAILHDLDARMLTQTSEEEREDLAEEVVDVLRRLYLLMSCMLVAYQVRDIPRTLNTIGFAPFQPTTDLAAPIFVTFCILFIILLLQHVVAFIASPLPQLAGGHELDSLPIRLLISDQFWLWCYSAAIVVFSCGSAVYAAIVLRMRWLQRSASAGVSQVRRVGPDISDLTSYFYIFLGAYVVAFVSQLLLNLILRIQQLLNTTAVVGQSPMDLLSTVMRDAAVSAIAPTGGAVLACVWLSRKNVQGSGILGDVSITALVMGVLAAFATFLRFNGPNQVTPLHMLWSAISFYGLLYVISGIAVGMLAAMLRSHREQITITPAAELAAA